MSFYPDTSFLCAIYREQDNSTQADALFKNLPEPLPVAAFVLFAFRQSVRWQTFLHRKDPSKGYGDTEGSRMLADLQSDLSGGRLKIVPVDWAKVISTGEQLSAQYTGRGGYRAFDILHVATALELGAKEFLTFDARQTALAKAAGLKTKP
jgi:predicted nucleic acid-binding protein